MNRDGGESRVLCNCVRWTNVNPLSSVHRVGAGGGQSAGSIKNGNI
jgi:hypothetical protein